MDFTLALVPAVGFGQAQAILGVEELREAWIKCSWTRDDRAMARR
jgi:hypothetical protein